MRVVAELFKLAALFVSGTFLIPEVFAVAGWQVYVFALVAVIVVRPLALPVALAGTGLQRGVYAAASWFGPKGFASVVYGLIDHPAVQPRRRVADVPVDRPGRHRVDGAALVDRRPHRRLGSATACRQLSRHLLPRRRTIDAPRSSPRVSVVQA